MHSTKSKGTAVRFTRGQRWADKRRDRHEGRVAAVIGIGMWANRCGDEFTAGVAEQLRVRLAEYNARTGPGRAA